MSPDIVRVLAGWLGGPLLVGALLGATYLTGRMHGRDAELARWTERQIVAERAARQTERDLAALAAKSAERTAEKERMLDEQAQRQNAVWRQALARVPACRVPAAVGVQLDAVSGAAPPAGVAAAPQSDPDAAARLAELTGVLETVRRNYAIARQNADRLEEAARWYADVIVEYDRQRKGVAR